MDKCTFTCSIKECKMDGSASFASFHCSICHRLICMNHLRRRKSRGSAHFGYVCVECLPGFDQARKNKEHQAKT